MRLPIADESSVRGCGWPGGGLPATGRFNEDLVKAGVVPAAESLLSTSHAKRYPNPMVGDSDIELRPVVGPADFSADLKDRGLLTLRNRWRLMGRARAYTYT